METILAGQEKQVAGMASSKKKRMRRELGMLISLD
jgi:hypothetical protein